MVLERDFSREATLKEDSLMDRFWRIPFLAYSPSISCFSSTSRSSALRSSSSSFFSRCNSSVSSTCSRSSSAMRRFCCRMRFTEASSRSSMSSSQLFLSSSSFCSYSFFSLVFCSMNLRSISAIFTSCWCLSSSFTSRNRSISASISSWRSLKSLRLANSFCRNSTCVTRSFSLDPHCCFSSLTFVSACLMNDVFSCSTRISRCSKICSSEDIFSFFLRISLRKNSVTSYVSC
mmetsp:Transcript_19925/g.43600  ORF Transcript_19925/g.43600 Transcript_19925/m.43600 type:complete len:233 (-) Transcript_19925:429-1127(-)